MPAAPLRFVVPAFAVMLLACAEQPAEPEVAFTATEDGADALFFSSWSAPVDAGPHVNAPGGLSPAFSPDGLSLYFASSREGGEGGFDIWVSRRTSLCDDFGPAVNLGWLINTDAREQGAFLSADGRLLFFTRGEALMTAVDIYVSRRANPRDDLAWEEPVRLGPEVNTPEVETEPWMIRTGRGGAGHLYFGRGPTNLQQDLYVVPIDRNGVALGPATPIAELNSPTNPPMGNEDGMTVRRDGREAMFASRRFETGAAELFVSRRASAAAPWGPPELIPELNSDRPDLHPALSHDGRTLAWSSARSGPGEFRIYMSTRTPGGRTAVVGACETAGH